MEEEEQFENIDLNDDNICSVCKLETETGTLSFCHVCFELNLEGKEQKNQGPGPGFCSQACLTLSILVHKNTSKSSVKRFFNYDTNKVLS